MLSPLQWIRRFIAKRELRRSLIEAVRTMRMTFERRPQHLDPRRALLVAVAELGFAGMAEEWLAEVADIAGTLGFERERCIALRALRRLRRRAYGEVAETS